MAEEKHTHHHEHDHEHGHHHHHHHHHHEEGPLKPGEHPDWRTHVHAPGEHHEIGVNDYMTAVAAYRKTFASKEDVLEQTPDPAVREMIKYLGQLGHETIFDRFDQQKPQCTFGLAGVCCKNCNMGPCKITKKSPRASAVRMPMSSWPATCCAARPQALPSTAHMLASSCSR